VYYDLVAEREKRGSLDTAIVRMEQLYPYPEWNLSRILDIHKRVSEIFWVQEEPQNMGAWHYIARNITPMLPIARDFRYVGRPDRASPASGSFKIYRQEQDALLRAAFE
jgi:2-oxoglutarate dehydrogenase complex dehydrogenase (E1) component-like enzyme